MQKPQLPKRTRAIPRALHIIASATTACPLTRPSIHRRFLITYALKTMRSAWPIVAPATMLVPQAVGKITPVVPKAQPESIQAPSRPCRPLQLMTVRRPLDRMSLTLALVVTVPKLQLRPALTPTLLLLQFVSLSTQARCTAWLASLPALLPASLSSCDRSEAGVVKSMNLFSLVSVALSSFEQF